MMKRSLVPILLVCAALGVACGTDGGTDGGFQPAPRVFSRFEVTPTAVALATVAPATHLQLTIAAYDQYGAPLSITVAATYASSAPAIAGVNSGGAVMAAAPGTAEIT